MECPEERCIVCGRRRYALRYDFTHAGIWRCASCGMMTLWPRPRAYDMRGIYDERYFRNDDQGNELGGCLFGYADYLNDKPFRQADQRRIMRMVKHLLPVRRGDRPTLLEIGPAMGFLMETAFRVGFEVEGIEVSRFACDYVQRTYGFPMHCADATEAQPLRDGYDLCFLLDVIEHLPRPVEAMQRVARWVRPGGLCVMATMDCDSFVSRMLGRHMEDVRRVAEHVYYFNRSTLARFVRRFGFEVEFVRSFGLTFDLGSLLDRLDLTFPPVFSWIKRWIRPRRLLRRRIYVNPGVKLLMFARRLA